MVPFVFLALVLAGCSDFKFVNSQATDASEDPRENIVLSGVNAYLTSGSLVQNKVRSAAATFIEMKGILKLSGITVESFGENASLQALTTANAGTVFMVDSPSQKRRKSDISFEGNVIYRAPSKSDPTTDSITLSTESLLWDTAEQKFRCDTFYRMVMSVPGRPPFIALGDEFVASSNLRWWNVRHGALGTGIDAGVREASAKSRDELVAFEEAARSGRSVDAGSGPVEIPPEMRQAEQALSGREVQNSAPDSTGAPTVESGRRFYRIPMPAPSNQ